MKKIFTLLVAVGLITFAQAQSGRDGSYGQRDRQSNVERGFEKDSRYNTIMSPEKQRDLEIASINREYDYKIQKVRDSYFKRRSQKKSQIRLLEAQRQQEIRMVYTKFSREQGRYGHSKRRY